MDLLDANILIGAFRRDSAEHPVLKRYLERQLATGGWVTFPVMVEAAFLRIVTHPKVFREPSRFDEARKFLDAIFASGGFREPKWTARTREQWREWCESLSLSGNDINDALLAALASEHGYRLVSCDEGFSRFRGVAWWNPLHPAT
jgi:hypothetical protein